jgi:hypothetical protein
MFSLDQAPLFESAGFETNETGRIDESPPSPSTGNDQAFVGK